MKISIQNIFLTGTLLIFCFPFFTNAQVNNVPDGQARVDVFPSPRTGSFAEGSTFEVPVFINTNTWSIGELNIKIDFDRDKLGIVEPSGGRSIVGFWTEPPKYDNTNGTVSYIGTIPGGIVTESGLLATITFKALSPGQAKININSASKVLLNDGLNTSATIDLGRAEYTVLKKISQGISVFSETHPSEGKWYNNGSPVLSWQRDVGVDGFSYELDNKPFTVPDNVVDGNESTKSYDNLNDGLWYFHVKAIKAGAWGTTGHFIIKIDTVPPAKFAPETNNFLASSILAGRTLVSFFTTDNLSGVDHYEVGTIDESQPITEAPVFIESGSPFQVPVLENSTLKVIVRAIDKAGNVREGFIEVGPPFIVWKFLKNHITLVVILVLLITSLILYFRKYRVNPLKRLSTFNILETDIKNYLSRKKEMQERNIMEKEKIEILERDLESVKTEIDKEIKDGN